MCHKHAKLHLEIQTLPSIIHSVHSSPAIHECIFILQGSKTFHSCRGSQCSNGKTGADGRMIRAPILFPPIPSNSVLGRTFESVLFACCGILLQLMFVNHGYCAVACSLRSWPLDIIARERERMLYQARPDAASFLGWRGTSDAEQ